MAFRFNSVALLLSSLLTGGGAWVGYELYKPKTVRDLIAWKGFTLASEEDSGIWEALYFQGKAELGDKVTDASTLKQFCVKTAKEKIDYSSKNYEHVEKFCVNALKSRRARIISKGFKETDFLSTDDDYKLAFIFNRYSPTFLSLLGKPNLTKDTEIDDNSELLQSYKDYCSKVLNEDDIKIAVSQQLCSKSKEKTVVDLLTKDGYTLRSDQELEADFEKYKQDNNGKDAKYVVGNTLLEAIKDVSQGEDSWLDLTRDKNKFATQFKKYCNEQKEKSLYAKDFLKDVYPKFKSRCANEIKPSR
ncbi:hypothetical protein A6V39_04095 [Candidatus Mycoplasma haematobovis]|uniref:Uncharacterized protein n=1 Tax=Candidatus Mycoplasma haematobovis TaxID=432608 RepID=A0A1A9QEF4_9MOLU|nr:hypothetical protein [Candidatus Mycoplasma haematobovis]OAL10070.1 hypothetical protein A6V39_04095 [Candidatus Mycoplasma haematobovis]